MLGVDKSTKFWRVRAPWLSRKLPISSETAGAIKKAKANRKKGRSPSHASESRRGVEGMRADEAAMAPRDPIRQAASLPDRINVAQVLLDVGANDRVPVLCDQGLGRRPLVQRREDRAGDVGQLIE